MNRSGYLRRYHADYHIRYLNILNILKMSGIDFKRRKMMFKINDVQEVKFGEKRMFLKVNGKEYVFQISNISKKLANASTLEREKFEISPSGYGLHWPLLDEDLSIDGLLGIKHTPPKKKKVIIEK